MFRSPRRLSKQVMTEVTRALSVGYANDNLSYDVLTKSDYLKDEKNPKRVRVHMPHRAS